MLKQEEREDSEGRRTHGQRWGCTVSGTLTAPLHVEGRKLRAALDSAVKSDAVVQQKHADIEQDLAHFAQGLIFFFFSNLILLIYIQ